MLQDSQLCNLPRPRALRLRGVFEPLVALSKLSRRKNDGSENAMSITVLLSALVRYTSTSDGAALRDDFELVN